MCVPGTLLTRLLNPPPPGNMTGSGYVQFRQVTLHCQRCVSAGMQVVEGQDLHEWSTSLSESRLAGTGTP